MSQGETRALMECHLSLGPGNFRLCNVSQRCPPTHTQRQGSQAASPILVSHARRVKLWSTESGLEFKLPDTSSSLEGKAAPEAMSRFPRKALRHEPLKTLITSTQTRGDGHRRGSVGIWIKHQHCPLQHFKKLCFCVCF